MAVTSALEGEELVGEDHGSGYQWKNVFTECDGEAEEGKLCAEVEF